MPIGSVPNDEKEAVTKALTSGSAEEEACRDALLIRLENVGSEPHTLHLSHAVRYPSNLLLLSAHLGRCLSLITLDLSRNGFGSYELVELSKLLLNTPNLQSLSLAGNPLGTMVKFPAAASTKPHGNTPSLRNSTEGLLAFRDALRSTHRLQQLNLSDCRLCSLDIEGIAAGIAGNTGLEHVILSDNDVNLRGGWALHDAVAKNASIINLDIGDGWDSLAFWRPLQQRLHENRERDVASRHPHAYLVDALSSERARSADLESRVRVLTQQLAEHTLLHETQAAKHAADLERSREQLALLQEQIKACAEERQTLLAKLRKLDEDWGVRLSRAEDQRSQDLRKASHDHTLLVQTVEKQKQIIEQLERERDTARELLAATAAEHAAQVADLRMAHEKAAATAALEMETMVRNFNHRLDTLEHQRTLTMPTSSADASQ